MKSILHQLDKYQQPVDAIKIIVPQAEVKKNFDFHEVAVNLDVDVKKLNSMPYTKYTGVLYPAELLAMHYLEIHDEKYADEIIQYFLKNQNPTEYFQLLKDVIDDTVKSTVYNRILIAALSKSKKDYDYLPTKYVGIAAKYLHFSNAVTLRIAVDNLERLNKASNYEQRILGRLIYMMAWRRLLEPESNILLLGF